MTDIKDLSKKLREAREKATSGDWDQLDEPLEVHSVEWVDSSGDPTHICSEFKKQENADFVILAANNILTILDELDRLIEVEKVLREGLEFYADKSLGGGNWSFRRKFCFDLTHEVDLEELLEPIGGKGEKYITGGRIAREALKRADEIGKGQDEKA